MTNSFLRTLDDAVARGSPESRARALWHASDLLIAGRFDEDEIWIFGEVIGRLADEIEGATRARLAKKLAHTGKAPFNLLVMFAFDDSIDVAGPILEHSPRLDSKTLVANIKTKGQPHLLAISKRSSVSVEVTDELVTRGNRDVVRSVASNKGAHFSDFGFLHMVKRSETDSILAEQLCLRKEIPRHLFQQLIAKASDDVRRKLKQERPDLAELIQTSVTDVTGALQSKFGPATKRYFAAKKAVAVQHQDGSLNESCIQEYARSRKIEETTVGLSLVSSLPVDVVERALVGNREMTLILTKAIDFTWETAMSLLFLGAKDHRISARDLDFRKEEFARLSHETCWSILNLYRSRKKAAGADGDQRRLPQLHVV
jgi:uncharacterized protein (DUF2336 family)